MNITYIKDIFLTLSLISLSPILSMGKDIIMNVIEVYTNIPIDSAVRYWSVQAVS